MSRSHPCPEESSVMHSKPLAPRPSGAAHPSASHPAASDPVASRPSASDPPASDPPASVPASPGGSAAAAAPARGRHDRGALAVLVLSLLQVTVEPLPDAVHAMIGSPEMAGYLLVQGLSLVSVLLTFALWAAVIWWLARSRHGDTLGLAPLLALGVVVLMDLVDPARMFVSMLVDALDADPYMNAGLGPLVVLSTGAVMLADLVLAALSFLPLPRIRPLQRRVRIRLAPVRLAMVLVVLLALFTVARPLLPPLIDLELMRTLFPFSGFQLPLLVSQLLSTAALLVLALVLARTEGGVHRLAWLVPILLWAGTLLIIVIQAVVTVMLLWGTQLLATTASLDLVLTLVVHVLTGAAATVVAALVLVLLRRARSGDGPVAQA